jgi:NADH dehydrogenase FAD-containing subunit
MYCKYRFLPDENAVVLKNGRKVEYNVMVNAMGLKPNMESIKGFYEAWSDSEHPVYTCSDHLSWKSAVNK